MGERKRIKPCTQKGVRVLPYLAWRRRGRGSHCLGGPAMCTKNQQCMPVSVAPPARPPAHAHLFHADPSASASFGIKALPKPNPPSGNAHLQRRPRSASTPRMPLCQNTFRRTLSANTLKHTFSATTFGESPSSFLPRRPEPTRVRRGLRQSHRPIHSEDRGASGRLIPLAVAEVAAGVRER